MQLPTGTTAQRPTPATGDIRFNTTITQFEGYNGSAWGEIAAGVPAGSVFSFATSTVPTGYLECNGAAVSRSTYASLFSSISTTWGVGDGSSTFNLPDLRGQFVRGWDNSAGVDSGRSFASSQSDQNKAHNHSVTDPGHTHSWDRQDATTDDGYRPWPASNNDCNLFVAQTGSSTTGISIQNDGGTEVRVKNYALMYVIKF